MTIPLLSCSGKRKNSRPDTESPELRQASPYVRKSLGRGFGLVLLLILLFANPTAAQQVQSLAEAESESDTLTSGIDYLELNHRIRDLISFSDASNAVWTVSVRDSTGSSVIDIDAPMLMRIASNSKLFTSAAVMKGLGPDFRFTTRIYGQGELRDSVWYGDIHFAGSGDPSIDKHHYANDTLYVFNRMIDQLKEYGIRSIRGDVFANESLFDDIRYPRGWEWDDLSYYYAPELSALSFNRNCVDLVVRANGRPGESPDISWFPFNTDYVQFVNEQIITPRNVSFNEDYARLLGSNTIRLRSTLPVGYFETESLSISDPALFFADSFMKLAGKREIDWDGEIHLDTSRRVWSGYEELASHTSEPVRILLKRLNRNSDNFYTEMLTKALAAYTLDAQGTTEAGISLILEKLNELGVDTRYMRFRDTSGMAGANVASAAELTRLLWLMNESEYRYYWRQTLARAGFHGTVENRFIESPALGHLYAKSGFISGVRTLSGYITTKSGHELSYSILTNNFTSRVATVDAVHERIINLLYENI